MDCMGCQLSRPLIEQETTTHYINRSLFADFRHSVDLMTTIGTGPYSSSVWPVLKAALKLCSWSHPEYSTLENGRYTNNASDMLWD